MQDKRKIPVGVSSCLLGNTVRFDGGHKNDDFVKKTLGEYFSYHPFCPEAAIGLPIPRPTLRLVQRKAVITVEAPDAQDIEVAQHLESYAKAVHPGLTDLCGFILKSKSPSCGMERVKVYSAAGMPVSSAPGKFAATLMNLNPHLPFEEEGRLCDPMLRENFIGRVYALHRWKQANVNSVNALLTFHQNEKLLYMSHSQTSYRELGRIAAAANKTNLADTRSAYFALMMGTLNKIATRKNHANALSHLWGYFKTLANEHTTREFLELLKAYQAQQIPLIVITSFLTHLNRLYPSSYVSEQSYLSPYPDALKLRNQI